MEKNSDAKGVVHICRGLPQLEMCAENGVIIMMDGPTQIKKIW